MPNHTHQAPRRRYRKGPGRRVWIFSELNRDLRPEHVAKIITTAGLERARLEAEAQADSAPYDTSATTDAEPEPDHA